MALTDTAVRKAKATAKRQKLFDGGGLYIEVAPAGGKWWRLKYRVGGKEKRISLGTYPDVTIKMARERRDEARRLIADGVDPSHERRQEKAAAAMRDANSFEAVAREWFAKFSAQWVKSHGDKIIRRLERDVFPWIGTRPIAKVDAPELLAVLRRIESRGAVETAHRAQQNCGQVFRYAVATGRAARDPSGDLKGALPPAEEKHHASITDAQGAGELLRAIGAYQGSLVTKCALQLAPLVFVRPGELRRAEWNEIDFDKAEWRIPAEKMKMRVLHIVPLSEQAIAILKEIQPLTGTGKYVFPSVRGARRAMSENTVLAALRRMGYTGEQMTGHGFRSMASTMLHELGWKPEAIERQLAHAERNNVKAAYNYAEYLPERRKMMQSWSDYLDTLKQNRKVVAGKFGKAA